MIHPVVLRDEHSMVLIDCGYTGAFPLLEQAMEAKGLSCEELTHVLITHQDHDHMGGLAALKEKYPGVITAASREEAPYISGRVKSLRLEQAEAMQQGLPEEQKPFGLAFCEMLRRVRPVEVEMQVQDGDFFGWGGGCTIIGTPGHTPGHISVYAHQSGTIVAGDAAALEHGNPVLANPQFILDRQTAERSLRRIMSYGAERVICYHGGMFFLKRQN